MQAKKHTDTGLLMHAFSDDNTITTGKLKILMDTLLVSIDIYILP